MSAQALDNCPDGRGELMLTVIRTPKLDRLFHYSTAVLRWSIPNRYVSCHSGMMRTSIIRQISKIDNSLTIGASQEKLDFWIGQRHVIGLQANRGARKSPQRSYLHGGIFSIAARTKWCCLSAEPRAFEFKVGRFHIEERPKLVHVSITIVVQRDIR